uniref:Uncharacterized protein n=1 Tax=Trichogramma kaykai TaxID=54128 RepID=A0ABD2WXP0_9HYME
MSFTKVRRDHSELGHSTLVELVSSSSSSSIVASIYILLAFLAIGAAGGGIRAQLITPSSTSSTGII